MPMMAHFRQFQGLACLLFRLASWASAIEYMDLLCGETISAGDSGGVLKSQSSYNYDNYEDCTVTIEAHSGRRILLTFGVLEIQGSGYSCPSDYLQVYDGSSSNSSTIGGDICGTTTPDDITSTWTNIALRFKSDGSISYRGFIIAYTSFKDGSESSCDIGEFKCDNERCIDSSLEYNGYDNCGDNSDEGSTNQSSSDDGSYKFDDDLDDHTLKTDMISLIVNVALILAVFIVIFVADRVSCKKSRPAAQPMIVSAPGRPSAAEQQFDQPLSYGQSAQSLGLNQPLVYNQSPPAYHQLVSPTSHPGELQQPAPPVYEELAPTYGQPPTNRTAAP